MTIVLVGFGASTCGAADYVLVRCSETENCTLLPGTICTEGLCVCPQNGQTWCNGQCRPIAACQGTSGAGGAGGTGGMSGGCTTPADCPQPGNWRCGTATCVDGVCGLDLKPFGAIESQILGDCKTLICDGDGNLTTDNDGTDTYNDGTGCTMDACPQGQPTNVPISSADSCSRNGNGICHNGKCVECTLDMPSCGPNAACDFAVQSCVPSHCVNNIWDQGSGETDKDCGGPCRPCDEGETCKVKTDCISGVCSGLCKAPSCNDSVKNGEETGTDCGGPPSCARCLTGAGCKVASDCESGVCWIGLCKAPTCTDGIKNGQETDWDCGGPECPPCQG